MKKNINFNRGFLRTTIVLSIIAGIWLLFFIDMMYGFDNPIEIPLAFALGFFSVRLIYFFIKYILVNYIVGGFRK